MNVARPDSTAANLYPKREWPRAAVGWEAETRSVFSGSGPDERLNWLITTMTIERIVHWRNTTNARTRGTKR